MRATIVLAVAALLVGAGLVVYLRTPDAPTPGSAGGEPSRSIGAGGGEVTLALGGNTSAKLRVPADATAGVTVTAAPLPAAGFPPGTLAGAVFGPSGTVFAKPATLVFELPATTNLSGIRGFASDNDGKNATMIPIDVEGTRVTMSVPHFSAYFLSPCPWLHGGPTSSVEEQNARVQLIGILCLSLDLTNASQLQIGSNLAAPTLVEWWNLGVHPHVQGIVDWDTYRLMSEAENWSRVVGPLPAPKEPLGIDLLFHNQDMRDAFGRALRDEAEKCASAETREEYDLHMTRLLSMGDDNAKKYTFHAAIEVDGEHVDASRETVPSLCIEVAYTGVEQPKAIAKGAKVKVSGKPVLRTKKSHLDLEPSEDWKVTVPVEGGRVEPEQARVRPGEKFEFEVSQEEGKDRVRLEFRSVARLDDVEAKGHRKLNLSGATNMTGNWNGWYCALDTPNGHHFQRYWVPYWLEVHPAGGDNVTVAFYDRPTTNDGTHNYRSNYEGRFLQEGFFKGGFAEYHRPPQNPTPERTGAESYESNWMEITFRRERGGDLVGLGDATYVEVKIRAPQYDGIRPNCYQEFTGDRTTLARPQGS